MYECVNKHIWYDIKTHLVRYKNTFGTNGKKHTFDRRVLPMYNPNQKTVFARRLRRRSSRPGAPERAQGIAGARGGPRAPVRARRRQGPTVVLLEGGGASPIRSIALAPCCRRR